MKKVFLPVVVPVLLVVTACSSAASPPPPTSEATNTPVLQPTVSPTEVPPTESLLDTAVEGIGGADALDGLSNLVIESSVIRRARGEGPQPDLEPGPDINMSLVSTHDVAGGNLRLDFLREGQNTREYSDVLIGDLGYIVGTDANFGGGEGRNMTSDRMASSRKHYRLTNPHLYLSDAQGNPAMVSDGGVADIDGVEHRLLVIDDGVAQVTLFVNSDTGTISKLQTMEHDHWLRDVTLEVFYEDWQAMDSGLMIPNEVSISIDDETMYEETRNTVRINATLDSDTFVFPEGADPVFEAELAAYGNLTSQTLQMFSARGFPQPVLEADFAVNEVATGVFHLTGSSHHSLAIEQENGIVIVEAPLYPERGEAIIDWAASTFPDKPITHVISSHHHRDHSSGLRAFVAQGITVVMGEPAGELFEVIFERPSTIIPDTLAENPAEPIFELVPSGGMFEVPDPERPVTAYAISPNHAVDTLFAYVGGGNVIFTGDGGAQIPEMLTVLEQEGLPVSWYAGGHGQASAFE